MKRSISILLAIILIVGTLSGCGGNQASSPSSGLDGGLGIDAATNNSIAGFSPFQGNFKSESPVDYSIQYPSEQDYIDYNTEEYSSITENRFVSVQNSPLSTFAADVDTASYANFRRYVTSGERVPADAIRIEEMVNYFNYEYPAPKSGEPFSCTTEVVQCPWNQDTLLLSIGLATAPINTEELPHQNLVFLIDTSGSMSEELELVKRSFLLLCDQLKSTDTISIVTYASGDEVVIDGASGDERDIIMRAIEELKSEGATNGSDGIITAYEIAEKHFIEDGNNRIILATDGDLNIGVTSEGDLERLISQKKQSGVFLSVMGFGVGNYKDNKLETLADKGNGNYSYIDSILEARKALMDDMGGTLVTVAKDVKLQVEFNPNTVKGYRLIGYENRLLAAEDFEDDTVDGGEIGAGHRVTALYEIVPVDSTMEIEGIDLKYQNKDTTIISGSTDFCTVNVRCKKPNGIKSNLWEYEVPGEVSTEMSANLTLASAVAQVGMLLRESEFSGTASYESVLEQLSTLNTNDALINEFIYLTRQVSRIGDTTY